VGGGFVYVCDAGADGGAANTNDPACADPTSFLETTSLGALPQVAAGEPFQIEYTTGESDGSVATLPAEPAVVTLAEQTATGWVLSQPGYLGFLARQGSDVLAFTHVYARRAVAVDLVSTSAGTVQYFSGDGSAVAFEATTGTPASLLAVPTAADGTPLAGGFGCTFASSDATLLALTAVTPIRASVLPLAPGSATLTATCGAMSASVRFAIDAGDGAATDLDASDGPLEVNP
jgi:hypothetical protein